MQKHSMENKGCLHLINKTNKTYLMEKQKRSAGKLEQQRPVFIRIGYIVSSLVIILAFSWTTRIAAPIVWNLEPGTEDLLMIPVTRTDPPKTPEPPKFKLEKISKPQPIDDRFRQVANTHPDPTVAPAHDSLLIDLPPIVEPYVPGNDLPFVSVERMPVFKGCNNRGSEKARNDCSIATLMEYLQKNIRIPDEALRNKVNGTLYTTFVVGADGKVRDVKLKNSLGFGVDQMALNVLNNMPVWTAGEQRDQKVSVIYTLPIRISTR